MTQLGLWDTEPAEIHIYIEFFLTKLDFENFSIATG